MPKYEYFLKKKKVVDGTMMDETQIRNMLLCNIANELARIADIMEAR